MRELGRWVGPGLRGLTWREWCCGLGPTDKQVGFFGFRWMDHGSRTDPCQFLCGEEEEDLI